MSVDLNITWNKITEDGLKEIRDYILSILEEEKESKSFSHSYLNELMGPENNYDDVYDGVIKLKDFYIRTVKGSYVNNQLVELIYEQGLAYSNFQGTCGLCSTANVVRMLKVGAPTEKDAVDMAMANGLCRYDEKSNDNGGTTYLDRVRLASLFNLNPIPLTEYDLTNVEKCFKDGGAFTFTVFAEFLRSDVPNYVPMMVNSNHCITCVGLKLSYDNEILGMYVLDTGGWITDEKGFGYLPIDKFNKMKAVTNWFSGIENYREE